MPNYNNPVKMPEELQVWDTDAGQELSDASPKLAAELWPGRGIKLVRHSEDLFILDQNGNFTKRTFDRYAEISPYAVAGRLFAQDNSNNLRQIQLDFSGGEFVAGLSKPVSYVEAKSPSWWKQILHALFKSLFAEEFAAYERNSKFNEACQALVRNDDYNVTIQPLEAEQAEVEHQQPQAQEDGLLVQNEPQNEVQQQVVQDPNTVEYGFEVYSPETLAPMKQRMNYSLNGVELPKNFEVKGEDLGVLVAMAQGTSDLYYKKGHKKKPSANGGKQQESKDEKNAEVNAEAEKEQEKEPAIIQNDPDKNYKALVGAHFVRGEDLKSELKNFITAGTVLVRRALRATNEGNYTQLARILAHGLVQNNKVLMEQKKLTNGYTGYADLGAKAVEFVERIPKLKEAVLKELGDKGEKQFDIAKAAKNISDLRVDVMSELDNMARSYNLKKDGKYIVDGVQRDVAKVCVLSQIEMGMNLNKFNLADKTEYAKQTTIEAMINTIANTDNINNFLLDSNRGEKLRNPKTMMKVANRAIRESEGKMKEAQVKNLQGSKELEQDSAQNNMEQIIS